MQIFVVKSRTLQIYFDESSRRVFVVSAVKGDPPGEETLLESHLSVTTDDPPQDNDLVFDVLIEGEHGGFFDNLTEKSVRTFSVEQVRDGRVFYRLLSTNTKSKVDAVRLRARIGRAQRDDLILKIRIERKPVIEAAALKEVRTPRGKAVFLTDEFVDVTYTGDITDDNVFFVLTKPPLYGRVTIHQPGSPPARTILFSLSVFKKGQIAYEPTAAKSTVDEVGFFVTNGYRNVSLRLNIRSYLDQLEVTTSGLNVSEGGLTTVRLTSLNASAPPEHSIVFVVSRAPRHGVLTYKRNTFVQSPPPVERFTYEDLKKLVISYVHDGSETSEDQVLLLVKTQPMPGSTFPDLSQEVNLTFVIRIKPSNNHKPRKVNAERDIPVVQFGRVRITPAQLEYTDDDLDFDSSRLKYTLVTKLTGDRLVFDSSPADPITVFYQDDINKGRLTYYNSGGDESSKLLEFTVEDESPQKRVSLFLSFSVKRMTLNLVSMPAQLQEGGMVTLDNETLVMSSNLNTLSHSTFKLQLITGPKHGSLMVEGRSLQEYDNITWDQVQGSAFVYRHDDSDTVEDMVSLTPIYSHKTFPAVEVLFTILPVDDTYPDIVTMETLLVDESSEARLTSLVLLANDTETSDGELIFTMVTFPRNGRILLGGEESDSFSQRNVSQGLVVYHHTEGSHLADQFVFNLTDGRNTITDRVFHIIILPVHIPLVVGSVTVREGGGARLNTTIISVNNSFLSSQEVQFWLESAPQHGIIVCPSPLEVNCNFSLRTLEQGCWSITTTIQKHCPIL